MTQQDGNASSNAAFDKDSEGNPGQVLGLSDATAIIVGLIVGAGIFGTPRAPARHARSGSNRRAKRSSVTRNDSRLKA